MSDIMIPTMLFWENGNDWYGSKGNARFYIKPVTRETEGEEPDEQILTVELWRGPFEKALSEILDTTSFPMSEEGLAQVVEWLEGKAAELNKTEEEQ